MRNRTRRHRRETIDVDANWKYREPRQSEARRDEAVVDIETELMANVVGKVDTIVFGLESDQIVGQHRLDQLAMVRDSRRDAAYRPRRVQKKSDRFGDAL